MMTIKNSNYRDVIADLSARTNGKTVLYDTEWQQALGIKKRTFANLVGNKPHATIYQMAKILLGE